MQFDANAKNKQQLQSCQSKYTQQSLKAREGQTYVSSEDGLYKVLVHADGGGGNSSSLPQNLLHNHCLYYTFC
jgi:hypothetical protein